MAEQKAAPSSLNALLFPMKQGLLVSPDVTVAEIVDYQKARSVKTDCDWLLGDIEWRNIQVPVISFDKLIGEKELQIARAAKIVVMHTLSQRQAFKFWAFVVHDSPTMQTISEEVLIQNQAQQLPDEVIMQADLLGEHILLPNITLIEKKINDIHCS